MDRSEYIARLMGPVMLIIGIGMIAGMLTEGNGYSSILKEFIASRALIFVTGVLALVVGLAVVNAHNLWVRDWRLIVTILGWLFILRGVSNLVFPSTVQTLVLAGAAATIALGSILSIMGYEDLWNNTPRRQSAAKVSPSTKRVARARRKSA